MKGLKNRFKLGFDFVPFQVVQKNTISDLFTFICIKLKIVKISPTWPRGNLHFGNGFRNLAYYITEWGFPTDYYKINPIG
jgi:hypothetical protein